MLRRRDVGMVDIHVMYPEETRVATRRRRPRERTVGDFLGVNVGRTELDTCSFLRCVEHLLKKTVETAIGVKMCFNLLSKFSERSRIRFRVKEPIESPIVAKISREIEVRVEASGLVACLFQKFGNCGSFRGESFESTVLKRVRGRHDGRERGPSRAGMRKSGLERFGAGGALVEIRSRIPIVAVPADVIRAERIDRHENDVAHITDVARRLFDAFERFRVVRRHALPTEVRSERRQRGIRLFLSRVFDCPCDCLRFRTCEFYHSLEPLFGSTS